MPSRRRASPGALASDFNAPPTPARWRASGRVRPDRCVPAPVCRQVCALGRWHGSVRDSKVYGEPFIVFFFFSFFLFLKDALSDSGQKQCRPQGSKTSLVTGRGKKDASMAVEDLGCGQEGAGDEGRHLAIAART